MHVIILCTPITCGACSSIGVNLYSDMNSCGRWVPILCARSEKELKTTKRRFSTRRIFDRKYNSIHVTVALCACGSNKWPITFLPFFAALKTTV